MRIRVLAILGILGITTLTLSLIRGQEKVAPTKAVPPKVPAPVVPMKVKDNSTPPVGSAKPPAPLAPARDLSHFTGLSKQMLQTAQRASDWLFRMHGFKGRFQPGVRPALNQVMTVDSFFRQAGATTALARAARFCGEDRYAARSAQAILVLLDETALDPNDSLSRVITLPPVVVNRLGASAAIVLAINELPNPQKDLLDRSEQLCRSLRKMVRPDGALGWDDGSGKLCSDDDGIPHHPGLAIQALVSSYQRRPAPWKLEIGRKALPYYRTWWKGHKDLDFVNTMAPAFAEVYMATKDKECADFVREMADWLCPYQYVQIDPRRALWFGGFRTAAAGKMVESEPTVAGAACATTLIAASRVARESGDLTHHQRYVEAVERTLQFLTTLQYTDGGTQHFASWYRPQLLGAFHTSHADGNLRIEDTQQAVVALLGYLEHVVR